MAAPQFETVLVANRGEIARRVLRTLREQGIRSVAVYSDADANAPHVREADVAVRIGPAAAAESYLSSEAVLEAAKQTGAQAIHPGYGFLSENADFARACAKAGITFIGPDVHALDIMGDKIRSKEHVAAHDVPTVPGFSAAGMSDAQITQAADAAGYPLLIKPSAGGGGKGMQIVRSGGELPEALAAARRVAQASFGDDTLLLERLIEEPRHIEVQVLADTRGNIVHLGERECTLQRRHQKVIEEAPSPIIDAETRARLGAAACAAAASVAYRGAGTVEFLVSDANPSEFFFIEMNTRLQVEHPVTELVTGIDLVEQQLRVAAGEPLPFTQSDIVLTGHAIEARVYAESPVRGFVPATGHVQRWVPSPNARIDSAIEEASDVTAHYDPMIAKVIAYGDDRAGALAALDLALAETVLLGVESNIGFLRALLADPAVQAGDMDTGLIDRMPPYTAPRPSEDALGVAARMAGQRSRSGFRALGDPELSRTHVSDLWARGTGWRLGDTAAEVPIAFVDENGDIIEINLADVTNPRADAAVRSADGPIWVHADGLTSILQPLTRRERMQRRLDARDRVAGASDPNLLAPMPGAVVAVHVADGARVSAGDKIVTVEAMKMEQPLTAPHDGTVSIAVTVGDQVRLNQVLATVQPDTTE